MTHATPAAAEPEVARPIDPLTGRAASGAAALPRRAGNRRVLSYLVFTLGSALYLLLYLRREWVPFDDGALAHTAERVQRGELPHRDFDDPYTGLLAAWYAAGFALFGTSLASIRWMLLAAFVGWVPLLLRLAERVVGLRAGLLLSAACVVWSVPNYPAGMPSWYNLFLATAALLSTTRFLARRERRWLLLAGVCVGLSSLVKIVGLFALAGLLLFLVFEEQLSAEEDAGGEARRNVAYAVLVSGGLSVLVAAVARLTARAGGDGYHANFLLPVAALGVALGAGAWRRTRATSARRLRRLLRTATPLAAGFVLPILLWLVPYVRSDAIAPLVEGVFLRPMRRLDSVRLAPPFAWLTIAFGLVLPAAAWFARRVPCRPMPRAALLACAIAVVIVGARSVGVLHSIVWYAVVAVVPLGAAAGALLLARPRAAASPRDDRRAESMLLLATAVMVNLTRVPYDAPIYFCYVAPVLFLAAASLARAGGAGAWAMGAAGALLLAFGVADLNRSVMHARPDAHDSRPTVAPLTMPRGGIAVESSTARQYAAAMALVARHSRPGDAILAGPDSPEIYFLTARRNATRITFDVLDDTPAREQALLEMLERERVPVVVLNAWSARTRDFSPAFLAELERRYPRSERVGAITVRWR